MFDHFHGWFATALDFLFAIEFLVIAVYLIVHSVRTLFFPRR